MGYKQNVFGIKIIRGSAESFVRGGKLCFFLVDEGEMIKISLKRAIVGPPAKHHSLAC